MTKADMEVGVAAVLARIATAYAVLGKNGTVVPSRYDWCRRLEEGVYAVCPLSAVYMAENKLEFKPYFGQMLNVQLWFIDNIFGGCRYGRDGFLQGVDGDRQFEDIHVSWKNGMFELGFRAGRAAVERFNITNK